MKLKKAALFTDIHVGAKGNSLTHLQDCSDYVDWFVGEVKKDKKIDHIIFLGDWHDKRDSINILTMNYSYDLLNKLYNTGLKVYILTGNHDGYFRNNLSVHSLVFFKEFENITLIDTPTVCNDMEVPILLCPYLFEHEYIKLHQYDDIPVHFIHGEFKGFVLTGSNIVLEHGPDPKDFSKPKRIFTGHFHKRQSKYNITYIGNVFPMNFSDANDTERGFATYEYASDKLEFFDYANGPSYVKCSLSKLLKDHSKLLKPKTTVRCLVDADISMEESIEIKEMLMKKYSLRELTMEETQEDISLTNDIEIDETETTEKIIRSLLDKLVVEKLDKDKLIKEYDSL